MSPEKFEYVKSAQSENAMMHAGKKVWKAKEVLAVKNEKIQQLSDENSQKE